MSMNYQMLEASVEYALTLLKGIRDGEEDYEALRESYDLALECRKESFGEALFLDPKSIIELISSEHDLSEGQTSELERSVEMINLATFAYHVFYAREIQTCLCAFFRTFKPLLDVYGPIEIDMYNILRMALFRQRFNASDNIGDDIEDIIDRTFPAEDSKYFGLYYLPDDYHQNDTIKWLMDLREKVLRMLPVENLDPEGFADEEEIRDILMQFLEHRYRWYDSEGSNLDQNPQEPYEIHSGDDNKPYLPDKDQPIRQSTPPTPSFGSQSADEQAEHHQELPPPSQLQASEESSQRRHRSLFSPDPNAYVLTSIEADFGEDAALSVKDDSKEKGKLTIEVDELAEDSSASNASPSPNLRDLSHKICRGTQTSPSLLPAPARPRRTLPAINYQTTETTSGEAESSRSRVSSQTSSRNYPADLTERMFVNSGGRLQKIPKLRKRSIYWTNEETTALEEGVRLYGRQWSLILSMTPELSSRNAEQLKDKAVNECKRRRRRNEDMGGFKTMSNQ